MLLLNSKNYTSSSYISLNHTFDWIDFLLNFNCTKYHLLTLNNKKHYSLKVEVKLFWVANKEI